MLDAIFTLNTDVSNLTTSIPSQIKTNNQRTLATVEYNPEAVSRAYVTGEYLVANGKLYKVLNNIAEGAALQDNVNIEWVLLGDEVSNLRGSLKSAAFCTAVNNLDTVTPTGYVLDARVGPWIRNNINNLNTNTTSLQTRMAAIESKFVIEGVGTQPPVDVDTGKAVTSVPAATSRWLRFPFNPKSGYKAVGILGYYLCSYGTTSYYANVTVYNMRVQGALINNKDGVLVACTTPASKPWAYPKFFFDILWKKV